MEPGGGNIVEILSGALSRKHVVEVCRSPFLYGFESTDKFAIRQSLVRRLTLSLL